MKNRTSGHTQNLIMEGADVYDAIQALRNQEPHPIGMFLNDAAPILSEIADLLDPLAETDCKVRLQFSVPPAPALEDDCEWVGSRSQVEEAISARHATTWLLPARPGRLSSAIGTVLCATRGISGLAV
jgi:hypothetical protein